MIAVNATGTMVITNDAIEPQLLRLSLVNAAAGAFVAFEGWVRNRNEGCSVLRLEYEAYEPIAVSEGEAIIANAIARFDLLHAFCVHRTGLLDIGDCAVWVGVSSGHRRESFEACRHIIDEVKHRLPIWKKEYYDDGDSGWVNCERCSPQLPGD